MQCTRCGVQNPEGMNFCEECGAQLMRSCPSCGQEVKPTAKFCGKCGTPLLRQSSVQSLESKQVQGPQSKVQSHEQQTGDARLDAAERRQLTVMFCDLVGSTALSTQLDPEELREVEREYQRLCATVISRFEGYLAKYIGDGLLVYFGYPVAHEDDARRAVHAALGIIEAIHESPVLKTRLQHPLQVRIGIHTGLVVAGEMGTEDRPEPLAIVGETPNIAARLQGLAEPDTVVLSAATQQLVAGMFECQYLGLQMLKGISTPLAVYRVVGEGTARSRFEVAVQSGLTPLVGRAHEVGLLQEHWERAKEGEGQAVLLSGEAGIGKSRLVQELKEHISTEGATRIEFRCSPYYQNSALYPIIDHLQRLLRFARDDAPATKLGKLQLTLSHYRFPQADTVPLLAALLSLPHPEGSPPLSLSPPRQKQKTHEALIAWIMEEAERQAVYCTWEDLHWVDPTTLEILHLYLDQVPIARMLAVLTFRPEFTLPWGARSHITQLTLSRLEHHSVGEMVEKVAKGKALSHEILQQIVAKTDGVPLFVEELTKTVLESIEPIGSAIPATLHDALIARLDRMGSAKEIAQLGATLGREFSYEVLRAVSPRKDTELQQALEKLVEAEVLYQRGVDQQAHYLFKHVLIQDVAYQSLLKSTRQQYHQQIAQVLEEKFSETKESQPELLAHHYTEARLIEQAIPYWQKAGERAVQRSTWVEAISHFTRGLELLKTLTDTPARAQQELTLQLSLNVSLAATRGYTAPEVKKTMIRVQELSEQLGETPQLFPVLYRLWLFDQLRGEFRTARKPAEQLMRLAQSVQDRHLLSWAHEALGWTLYYLGELTSARSLLEQAIALYNPEQHPEITINTSDPRVDCLSFVSWAWWLLGYPDQALKRSHEALALAREQSRPLMRSMALGCAAMLHLFRREGQLVRELAEETRTLSTEQGAPYWVAVGTLTRGGALSLQEQEEEGIPQLRQGLAALRAMGAEMGLTWHLALLAEAYGKEGKPEEGLSKLSEAITLVNRAGERCYEAELYRLKGTLTLQSKVRGQKSKVEEEAEECFLKAIGISRKQQAKSLELRATVSLAKLWQQQGKRTEAHRMLADIYNWFTEGFDTKDLQEAKALLDEVA